MKGQRKEVLSQQINEDRARKVKPKCEFKNLQAIYLCLSGNTDLCTEKDASCLRGLSSTPVHAVMLETVPRDTSERGETKYCCSAEI